MDANQSGDVSKIETVGLERLEDWKNNICSEEVQADCTAEEGDWRTKGW
jgi:hypothetical protein